MSESLGEATPDANDPVGQLLAIFDLDPEGSDRYRVSNPDRGFGDRVFGGQVAGQALMAASHTVDPAHAVHSLHAYFIRPGVPGVPITYEVERTRDGRSFTTRRVLARQGADAVFEMSCSFHSGEPGAEYQLPRARDVPEPDDAPEDLGFIPEEVRPFIPMELRELGAAPADEQGWFPSTRRVWMRLRRDVGDDPIVHACLLAFLSDMGAVLAARAPLPEHPFERLMGASLDHALWFHRPIRADEWFLYDAHAVSNGSGRGLMRGTMHSATGVLGVSVTQEALLRLVDPDRRRAPRVLDEDGSTA